MKTVLLSLGLVLMSLAAHATKSSQILMTCKLVSQPSGLDYKMDFQLESLHSKNQLPDTLTVRYSSYWDRVEIEGRSFSVISQLQDAGRTLVVSDKTTPKHHRLTGYDSYMIINLASEVKHGKQKGYMAEVNYRTPLRVVSGTALCQKARN